MLTKLKNMYRYNIDRLRQMLISYFGIWAAMFLLSGIIIFFAKPDDYPGMAGILCAVFGTLFLILENAVGYSTEFELAVKMSTPRKIFLSLYSFVNLSFCVIYAAAVMLIMLLDGALAKLLFNIPDNNRSSIFAELNPLLIFGILILANVAALLVGLMLGALLQRFGKAALWALWGLYMFFAFFSMGIGMTSNNSDSFLGRIVNAVHLFFSGLTPLGYGIVGGILALLAAATGVILLRKAPVKS